MFARHVVILALAASLAAGLPANQTQAHGPLTERGAVYQGKATIYLQSGIAGSCGVVHAESDLIMALSNDFMQYQYKSQWCGQRVRVTNYGSNEAVIGGAGNSVVVTVADTCASCGFGDVDFSIGAWNMLTNGAPWGTFNAGWSFCDGAC
ncbi:hypothetical protein QBC33DRAFT_572029 [Phialemonium atrogriseum]|uniref:Barwin domain-containing protein n=1 Tax=Phialemonium atrogriseum TaxID=1093897 RepID=A0AAJ0BV49_9PEZI|nr:uncharacterized protein QBC33DRAFT_572029 [Phialemonium atrogriseum]KAK1765053.1 hypothetical protein QBC33DRAFT_572029 [Phialemonium atrogriseum]